MGKWSERSVVSKPLVKLSTRLLTNVLSINVSLLLVILVVFETCKLRHHLNSNFFQLSVDQH